MAQVEPGDSSIIAHFERMGDPPLGRQEAEVPLWGNLDLRIKRLH